MKRTIMFITSAIWLGLMMIPSTGFTETARVSGGATYDLGIERSRETQFYIHSGENVTYSKDGSRTRKDAYRLYLRIDPVRIDGKDVFEYTCVRFFINPDGAKETSLPSLENWRFVPLMGNDAAHQIFGLDHSRFQNLMDADGNPVSFEMSYLVYNAFVDFLSFTVVFGEPAPHGSGIQDLQRIGGKIVHFTADSTAPINLGDRVSEESFFRNGKITLEFKGLSVINNRQCALVGMDSGESSFKMIMKPLPDMNINAIGGSHYKGDIYKDISTGWVQKAMFDELVISEMTIPSLSQKIDSVIERNILIRNVGKDEFMTR